MNKGRNPNGYWTEERCLEEAKKYKTIKEFRTKNHKAYDAACNKGLIKTYTWLERGKLPPGYWNSYNNCYNEAKKYKTKIEFKKNNGLAYKNSCKNGWIDKFTWFTNPSVKWTKDACESEAKKYHTLKEFRLGSPAAYEASLRNSWIDNYSWLKRVSVKRKLTVPMKPFNYWTEERCLEESKKYKTIGQFSKKSNGAYKAAKKNGWINNYTWLESPGKNNNPLGYWTYEKCMEAAKLCETKKEFNRKYHHAYRVSVVNEWIKEFTWLKTNRNDNWTYEEVYNIAKKYEYKVDFHKNDSAAYTIALKRGWIDDFDWFKPKQYINPNENEEVYVIYGYFDFSKKVCYIGLSRDIKKRHTEHKYLNRDTKKYDTVMQYFNSTYGFLPDPTIIEENLTAIDAQKQEAYFIKFFSDKGFTTLNKNKAGSLGSAFRKWNKETCYIEAKKYKSRTEFARGSSGAYAAALKYNWLKDYTWFEKKR